MAITLSLSADLAANINQEDLPASRTITATGVDSNDSAASFNFTWVLLDRPTTSTATLSVSTGATTTIAADVWGTYRIFCIAQNSATNETSNTDPLRAPLESFFNVSVESTNFDLEKPAKGQRNWHPQYRHLVDVVENMEANISPATFIKGGSVEIATAREIAQQFGVNDSSSGSHYLAVTTEELYSALHPTADGAIGSSGVNVLRNRVKDIALEKINESSITELKDVDITTVAPTAGQALIWDATHVDDTNGDVGAFVPGSVGSSSLFGVGLCAGETLANRDFLIYDADCTGGGPVAIPGWEAMNKDHQNFAHLFSFASPGRTSAWQATNETALSITWADDVNHPGMVSIADIFETARCHSYDTNIYQTSSQYLTAIGNGSVPSFALSPEKFAAALTGQMVGSIPDIVLTDNAAGQTVALYDPAYHTASEITAIQAAHGGGTFDTSAINVLQQSLSTKHALRTGRTSIDRLLDVDTTTNTPSSGQVLVWDTTVQDALGNTGMWVPGSAAGGGSDGSQYDIQLADASGGFQAANWTISSGDDFTPNIDNAYDVGTSSKRVRKLWAYDASFSDDVQVGDDLTVIGQVILQDYAFINDNGAAGTILLEAGLNGSLVGNITNKADETIITACTSGTEAKLSLENSAASKITLTTQAKQGSNHEVELPSASGTTGDVLVATSHATGQTTTEFMTPKQCIVYSTHLTREVDEEATFTSGNMNSFGNNGQACLFWVKNTTGNPITLKQAHVFVGEMKNVSLAFSLCKAASDSAAIANTWTQIGSSFSISNSSGSDNVLGQGQNKQSANETIANGEYIGVCCTDIPQANRKDKRLIITFECEANLQYA